MRTSPSFITELKENQIFVFGSNKFGRHNAGAAKIALEKFGAVYGQGYGLHGQSFAIDTMSGVERIEEGVSDLLHFAKQNHNLEFLVTEIGCGIAGYEPKDIAPLFTPALEMENVFLPKEFISILCPTKTQ